LLLIEDHLHNLKVHHYLNRQGYRLVKRTGTEQLVRAKGPPFQTDLIARKFSLMEEGLGEFPFSRAADLASAQTQRRSRPS